MLSIKLPRLILLVVWSTLTAGALAQEANLKIIHEKTGSRLKEIVMRSRGAMGFCALDLTSGERFALNENVVFPQASAIKVAILMEVYKQAGEGKFKLTDTRRIEKKDKAAGSGVLQELGDGTVQLTIHDLCVLMILVSDNTATNILIDLVGMDNINKTLESLGAKKTKVQRRMLDTAASWRGDENVSTPADAARIMELLFKGEFVNRKVCDEIISILKKTKPTNLKSGLPAEVSVANKPGSISGVATEWAIVYLKDRPYVVVVMENYGMEESATAMKEISSTLYDYFSRLARATSHGTYVEKPKE
jgi:beta-lactamase class A